MEANELLVRQLEALLAYQSTLVNAKSVAMQQKVFTSFDSEIDITRKQINEVAEKLKY